MSAAEDKRSGGPATGKDEPTAETGSPERAARPDPKAAERQPEAEAAPPEQATPPDEPAERKAAAEATPPAGKSGEDPAKTGPLAGTGPVVTPAAPASPGTATASPASPTAPGAPRTDRVEPATPRPATASSGGAQPAPASTTGRPASPSASSAGRSAALTAGAAGSSRAATSSSSPSPSASSSAAGGGATRATSPGARPGGSGRGGDGGRPPPVAPLPRSGGGGWLGGLIGGLLGGAAAWLVLSYVLPPAWQNEVQLLQVRVDELGEAVTGEADSSEQLAELARRVESLEAGPDAGLIARVDDLEAVVGSLQNTGDRLSALEAAGGQAGGLPPELEDRLAALEQGAGQPDEASEQLRRMEERLAALEADLTGLAAGGSEGDGAEASAMMSELREQVDQIQNELGSLQSGTGGEQLQALEQRLAASEETGPVVAELQERLQQVAGEVEKLTTAFPEFGQQMTETAGELENQLAALEEDTNALGDLISNVQQQVNTVQDQVSTLDQRLAGTEQSIETASERRDQAATLALAVGQLDSAIRQSQGYDKTLQTIRSIASEDQAVAGAVQALEPMAEGGPPSRDELRAGFDELAPEIVNSAADSDGLLGQAASNLRRLVSVRPVGAEVEGDDADARVARAEAALADGDLAAAVEELEGLEGQAAETAAPWLERARARLAAERAVVQLQERATGLLSGSQ